MCKQCKMTHEDYLEPATKSTIEALYREASLRQGEEIAPFVQGVVAELAGLGYSSRDCMGMGLALEEALVNGLRHGNANDPAKRVHVQYRITRGVVLIDVEDEGPGFDPKLVPDPTLPENLDRSSGRGLLLMRSFTTWLRYSARGNRVTLCKHRSA